MDEQDESNESQPLLPQTDSTESYYKSFSESWKSQWQWKNMTLHHTRQSLFHSCQWNWPPVVFLCYRVIAATYTCTILILSIVYYETPGKHLGLSWPVWLTNWSYALLTLHFLIAGAIVLVYTLARGRIWQKSSLRSELYRSSPYNAGECNTIPWFMKLSWFLYEVTVVSAPTVTIIFFAALYPSMDKTGGLRWDDANLHLMNSVMMLLELALAAYPLRLIHGLYSLTTGLIYMLFSIVLWGVNHNNVIYPFLDWNKPWIAVTVILVLTFAGLPLVQFVLFCLYRLRVKVFYKLCTSGSH